MSEYNFGREKTLYCIAVNLLDTEEIKSVLEKAGITSGECSIKEKSAFVSNLLREIAQQKNIELKLRKK